MTIGACALLCLPEGRATGRKDCPSEMRWASSGPQPLADNQGVHKVQAAAHVCAMCGSTKNNDRGREGEKVQRHRGTRHANGFEEISMFAADRCRMQGAAVFNQVSNQHNSRQQFIYISTSASLKAMPALPHVHWGGSPFVPGGEGVRTSPNKQHQAESVVGTRIEQVGTAVWL
jgi:hypothetical protein